jgi:endo-1,4-beta-mannosidase
MAMGTVYNGLADPQAAVGRVAALGLNTVRVTDFLDVNGDPATAPFDETQWRAVDRLIAAADDAGLYVVLDFSTYRNLLRRAAGNPYIVDWLPFLRFVAERVNTETGRRYAADPTIAMISFAGEVDGITGGENTYGLTSDQLTNFYRTVEQFWRSVAPSHLLTAGGLRQLDWESGIDWQQIFLLPYNDVNAVHVYTHGDETSTVPAVATFSRATGKPWIIEEFGYPASMPGADRADRYREMYDLAAANHAAGIGLWNVGAQTVDTYDVGPQFPLTEAVVRAHAAG